MAALSGNWARVFAADAFDEALMEDLGLPIQQVAGPESALDSRGCFRADRLARFFAPADKKLRTLVLTGRDIEAGNCSSLFGYADRRRKVAVVSTCRISVPHDIRKTRSRLRNVIAHELGHLRGLAHCDTPGCLMGAAGNAAELDSRREEPCGRCPGHSRFLHIAGAAVCCVLLFLALDLVGAALKPGRPSPFSVTPASHAGRAQVLFEHKPIVEVPVKPGGTRELESKLNAAYSSVLPALFEVEASPSGSALVRLNGAGILEATESGKLPPKALAESWSLKLREYVDGKGSAEESCPKCHVARRSEVVAQMRRRTGR